MVFIVCLHFALEHDHIDCSSLDVGIWAYVLKLEDVLFKRLPHNNDSLKIC